MGYRTVSYIAPLAIASAIGCGGAGPSPDAKEDSIVAVDFKGSSKGGGGQDAGSGADAAAKDAASGADAAAKDAASDAAAKDAASGSDAAAVDSGAPTAAGLTAAIATTVSGQTYSATVTLTNKSAELATNWQVGVNLNGATLNLLGAALIALEGPNGAEVYTIAGVTIFTPNSYGTVLAAGASKSFSFSTTFTGTYVAPTITSVDGVANGTPGAGAPADGVDHIARAVATGALSVAEAYENNKLPNTGDANYAQYDGLIWSADSFAISGNKIEFDPNVPGYAFVPVQAQAQLDAMQDSPEVASYLVAGLASCFADTSGAWFYDFKAGVLKGFTYPGPSSGTLPGGVPPAGYYSPPGYNPVTATDSYTATGAAVNGTEQITFNMTSTGDYWFGILTSSALSNFSNTSAILAKFTNGSNGACSPFNGAGGATSNPYFVITLNGAAVAARPQQNAGAQCPSGCTATLVVDPDPYAVVGPYYNAVGLVGPQPNPFALDPNNTAATIDHASQWATTTSQTGAIVYGAFSTAIVHRGVTTGYGWQQD
jgi:hypothetical protein